MLAVARIVPPLTWKKPDRLDFSAGDARRPRKPATCGTRRGRAVHRSAFVDPRECAIIDTRESAFSRLRAGDDGRPLTVITATIGSFSLSRISGASSARETTRRSRRENARPYVSVSVTSDDDGRR